MKTIEELMKTGFEFDTGKPLYPKLEFDLSEQEIKQALSYFYSQLIIQRNGAKSDKVATFIAQSDTYLSEVAKWLKNGTKRGLLLFGGAGSGKTTIATAICQLVNAYFLNEYKAGDSVRHAKRYFKFNDGILTAKMLAECYGTGMFNVSYSRCLFVDDLGREGKFYGEAHPAILETINYRNLNVMDTIITTNLNISQLMNIYGNACIDRLVELCEPIKMDCRSFRQ